MPDRLIFLCGFMGAGKSRIGWLLARKMKYSFYDLDDVIVEFENRSVNEIFEQSGEAHFRKLEKENFTKLTRLSTAVIALGGGTLGNDGIPELIRHSGRLVYIRLSTDDLVERLKNSRKRPLLKKPDGTWRNPDELRLFIEQLRAKRESDYELADTIFEPALNGTPEENADKLYHILNKS